MDPPLMEKPDHVQALFPPETDDDIIYYSCVTTGFLGQDASLCEIAVQEQSKRKPRSIKVRPNGLIHHHASTYNGYTTQIGYDGKINLVKQRRTVRAIPERLALKAFYKYISKRCARQTSQRTILVGWYSQRFDIPLLFKRHFGKDLKRLERKGLCYADPFFLLKDRRDERLLNVPNLQLPSIYQHLRGEQTLPMDKVDGCHDIKMLRTTLESLEIPKKELRKCSFTISSAYEMHRFRKKVKENMDTLKGRLYYPKGRGIKGDITEGMARKMAESGIAYENLENTYNTKGAEGLEQLLKFRRPNGKPRVTNLSRIINAIIDHFMRHTRNE